ncbi:MAG: hypothetical protein NC037_04515 [Bacteroides sp.]|nr:hypothetical protein [Bacillota bacterium]MCM1394020.1 hypothetical protein [[Eubacterium] siraeum]MCM1455775.1 hypothetical protein [Bacteroides sp.]
MDDLRYNRRTLAKTDVISGYDLVGIIVGYFAHTLAEGAICVMYDRNVTALGEDITREFKSGGYRVFVQAVSSKRHGIGEQKLVVPEYVRHVFAVGAGTAAEYAKKYAKSLGVDWSLYLTAPSTDTIMCGIAPETVFIDENVLINCPSCCKAAGYGILFSQPLAAFENTFAKKVLAKDGGETVVPSEVNSMSELAAALLEISLYYKRDSAQIMSEALYADALKRGQTPRLIGEYKFLASACITAFYSSYLGSPSIDTMPPACREVAADRLKLLGLLDNSPKSVDFFDTNGYFRISYILGEYRTDLLDKLGSIDFHTAQRFWRRLYPDAGYWLKGEITCRNLTDCLTLAGYGSDNLLGFAYASGIL